MARPVMPAPPRSGAKVGLQVEADALAGDVEQPEQVPEPAPLQLGQLRQRHQVVRLRAGAEPSGELGTAPGFCHHCHTGACPVGVTTQDPALSARLDPEVGARWVTNYLKALTMELTALARACGKSNVHHLEPEDLVALTVESAAMAGVPLAGTNWIPGR